VASASSSYGSTPPGPIGPGRVVLVVGPSGAGKDAILRDVQSRLAGSASFVFPRRLVTRQSSADEHNETVSLEEFEALVRRGALALHWNAHGLRYGLPAIIIEDALNSGCTVVVNASRQIAAAARQRYACAIVYVDAPLPVRAQRLAARNRERAEDIAARLARVVEGFDVSQADLIIHNDGSLAEASQRLVAWLLDFHAGA
jgi:ribose 1,5-bisphosphokinase